MAFTDLLAMVVLVFSVLATMMVARRRSGTRGGGAHRPFRPGAALDEVRSGYRVSRSSRRILTPSQTIAARGQLRNRRRAIAARAVPAAAQLGSIQIGRRGGGPGYV